MNWTIPDILLLKTYKKLSNTDIKYLCNTYTSLDHLFSAPLPAKYSKIFHQNELFASNEKSIDEVKKQIDLCEAYSVSIISLWDDEYPILLREISEAPVLLYTKGKLQNNDALSLSIVGTRRCSTYGKLCTERFTEYFTNKGIVITSGMAWGIDSIAHKSVIKKNAITYAVLASGLDCIQPSSSVELSEEIIEKGGAVISEYPCGTKALPPYFLSRNRIISGISKAILVIESAFKGGSLNTARWAIEQGRDVFAIPGNINSANSEGTNNLLLKGAIPALSPEQIVSELGLDSETESKNIEISIQDPLEKQIFKLLNYEPKHIDTISEESNIPIHEMLVKLLNLEFAGYIKQLPGKYYILSQN